MVARNSEVVRGLKDQIEVLLKEKGCLLKEEKVLRADLEEARSRAEDLERFRIGAEREKRVWEKKEVEMVERIEEMKVFGEQIVGDKRRMEAELKKLIEEMETKVSEVCKEKMKLIEALEESKRAGEEEEAQKKVITGQLKTLQKEMCLFKAQLEEEEAKK